MLTRSLLIAAALTAMPATGLATESPRTIDQGTTVGTFDASGEGAVTVRGQLTAFGRVDGSFVVRDFAGGAVVKLNGVVQRPKVLATSGGKVRVFTFARVSKSFYVKGRNVRISLVSRSGRQLSVSAYGRGAVMRLEGTGTFARNGDAPADWSEAATPLLIRAAKRPAAG